MATLRIKFPKVRTVSRSGARILFQVDPRSKGLKQEHFSTKKEALERADSLAAEFDTNGIAGIAMPLELREMAFAGQRMLAPLGASIIQACEFYRAHLVGVKLKDDSETISLLAPKWLAESEKENLRPPTLKAIRATKKVLVNHFGTSKLLEVTSSQIETFLRGLSVSDRRKYNLRKLFSQFFNWTKCASNPCKEVSNFASKKTDVEILTPEAAENLLRLCETRFPEFICYTAICLFAGLRPEEAQRLDWSNVHIEDKVITVLAETSKVNETRTVEMEPALIEWLTAYQPKKAKGLVLAAPVSRLIKLRVAAGYKGDGQNLDKEAWKQDLMRHSYGSYRLAVKPDRAHLAELMGNSIAIIKKHYRRHVEKRDAVLYWNILPAKLKRAQDEQAKLNEIEAENLEEMVAPKAKRN